MMVELHANLNQIQETICAIKQLLPITTFSVADMETPRLIKTLSPIISSPPFTTNNSGLNCTQSILKIITYNNFA